MTFGFFFLILLALAFALATGACMEQEKGGWAAFNASWCLFFTILVVAIFHKVATS